MEAGPPNHSRKTGDSPKAYAMQAAEDLRRATTKSAEELKQAASARVDHFRTMAENQAQTWSEETKQQASTISDSLSGESWDELRMRTEEFRVELERYVRQHPTKSVLISLGVGLIVGMMCRK